MKGEFIERVLMAHVMTHPEKAAADPSLHDALIDDDHRRAYRAIVDLGTSDALILAEHIPADVLEYLLRLAEVEYHFCRTFESMAQQLRDYADERAYQHSLQRLAPRKGGAGDPFRGLV